MKKIVMFDEMVKGNGLDGAITVAFPSAREVVKDGLQGLPFGTVEIDGKAWDWILKCSHYVFMEAE